MYHEIFLTSLHGKFVIEVCFNSIEKGRITRKCIPFDFGPSNRYKDGKNRYHLYDLESPDCKHNLSILAEQITEIVLFEETFEPSDYVTWAPKWYTKRDWGIYS